MGDKYIKYIIELEDKPFYKEDGDFLYRVKGFNSLVFDMTGISKLAPYTEPDLEQVRKEAHEQGLSDAWEAARKIANMDSEERGKIFGEIFIQNIQNIYSASEAIEKIREYEKEEIQVGNEVIYDGKRCVVVFPQTEHLNATVIDCGRFHHTHIVDYDELKKTGRHFPELVEVLRKMKEES